MVNAPTTSDSLRDWLVVVPARLASTRLPRKPLADLCGKPMIVRVYENLAPLAKRGAQIVVATDDNEVAAVLGKENIPCLMTRADHQSGTDRTFEVALKHHHELILNVQGDEPFAPTAVLAQVCQEFAREKKFGMATLACPTADAGLFRDPNCVKVATNAAGAALYFSRAPIPWPRDGGSPTFLRHAGVYFFRRHALKLFCTTPPAKTELTEKLEQLRAFDAGIALKVYETNDWPRGVDTAEDLEAARARLGKS